MTVTVTFTLTVTSIASSSCCPPPPLLLLLSTLLPLFFLLPSSLPSSSPSSSADSSTLATLTHVDLGNEVGVVGVKVLVGPELKGQLLLVLAA